MRGHSSNHLKELHVFRKLLHHDLFAHQHDHGHADLDEQVAPRFVREQRVPDPEHVGKGELLRQHEREPPEGEELRLEVLLLQPRVSLQVARLQGVHKADHDPRDSGLRLVQRLIGGQCQVKAGETSTSTLQIGDQVKDSP